MRRIAKALIATAAGSWILFGAATGVSAHHRPGCNSCGPITPSTIYKIVHPQQFVTKYHDVSRTYLVHRVRRVTTVVRVQPILHIHDVTRVHHHTIVTVSNAYHRETEHLSPIRLVTHSVEDLYSCGCRP